MNEAHSQKKKDIDSYDARFSQTLGGSEYEDLLIALDFYNELQSGIGRILKKHVEVYFPTVETINVLEAGPGTGITTLELLKADSRIKVISVDNEPKMLDVVRSKFAVMKDFDGRVEFVLLDILKFLESCEDESFEAFASVYTLHNFNSEYRKKVIALIYQKLKKGGIFINGDKYPREQTLHAGDFKMYIKRYEKFEKVAVEAQKEGDTERATHLRKLISEWTEHDLEDENNKITVKEQEELFSQLGFENVIWYKRFDIVATVSAIK